MTASELELAVLKIKGDNPGKQIKIVCGDAVRPLVDTGGFDCLDMDSDGAVSIAKNGVLFVHDRDVPGDTLIVFTRVCA